MVMAKMAFNFKALTYLIVLTGIIFQTLGSRLV